GGNATGVNFFTAEVGSKQAGLLHELIPAAAHVGLLVNPNYPPTDAMTRDATTAASAIGFQIDVMQASDSREIEAAFGALVRNRADALLVGSDPFFVSRRLQIATLAARHAIPAVYPTRDFAEAGGLMSYGASQTEAYRQAGIYTSKILKGAKPADLPVMQSTKFELVINLPTARAIGVVHILVPGKATEYRLPQQTNQRVAAVLARACIGEHLARHHAQPKSVFEFAVGQQSGIRGDNGATKLQRQAAVEIEPNSIRY